MPRGCPKAGAHPWFRSCRIQNRSPLLDINPTHSAEYTGERNFEEAKSASVMLGLARCYATPCGNHGNAQQRWSSLFWDTKPKLGSWGLLHISLTSPNLPQHSLGLLL